MGPASWAPTRSRRQQAKLTALAYAGKEATLMRLTSSSADLYGATLARGWLLGWDVPVACWALSNR